MKIFTAINQYLSEHVVITLLITFSGACISTAIGYNQVEPGTLTLASSRALAYLPSFSVKTDIKSPQTENVIAETNEPLDPETTTVTPTGEAHDTTDQSNDIANDDTNDSAETATQDNITGPTPTPTTAQPTATPTPTTETVAPEPTAEVEPTASPMPVPDETSEITVTLSRQGNFTPQAYGAITLTINETTDSGFILASIHGSASNLEPNRTYQLFLCGINCSSHTDLRVTSDSNGNISFNSDSIRHNQGNDPVSRATVWQIHPGGEIFPDSTACYNISLSSTPCLQGGVSL